MIIPPDLRDKPRTPLNSNGRNLKKPLIPALASIASALILGLSAPLCAAATASATTPQVQAELLAAANAVQPGEDIRLALHQRIIPHWHTYWINPGDSGLPTTIAWKLPAGARASDIEWPTPGRFKLGPVTNYGYENEVTLLSTVSVPDSLKPGEQFLVKATVDWLVCREECLPQQVELELSLPVVAPGTPRQAGNRLIDQAQAALPADSPWPVRIDSNTADLQLRASGPGISGLQAAEVWFYAEEWGKTSHGAPQTFRIEGDTLEMHVKPGEAPATADSYLKGILAIRDNNGALKSYKVNAPVGGLTANKCTTSAPRNEVELGAALLLSLLGGLILNLMPCVFPVLSIKALSLLKHVHQPVRQTRLQGLAYTAGVLASFSGLAAVLIALKTGGAEVGWGFQFQSPLFVLAVAYLMFAVGLSLSGVFTFGASVSGLGSSLAERSGYAGSFFTGVLATVVATPCTAPFMGAALGFALTQPAPVLLVIFLSLGLGLALPYLLLSFWPWLQHLLPRPGPWMERLKEGLAFPMYGAAAWLVWVLAQQAGPNAIAVALGGMVSIAFAAWLFEHSHNSRPAARHAGRGLAAVALAIALAGAYFGIASAPSEAAPAAKAWEPYSKARFEALRTAGKPVFVNFTAAWCITCLANEKLALSDDKVLAAFHQAGITYLKGDWTNRDPQISAHLSDFGRSGVPLYLFYPGNGKAEARVLPQLLTPEIVLAHLEIPAATNLTKE